jgi:1-acyl-sn-glycerol-3-phosphate acyltransferase
MAKAELFQKDLPESERIFYYETEKDDPIRSEEQGKEKTAKRVELPEGYVYIRKNPFIKLYSWAVYRVFKLFTRFYAKNYLHMTVKNRKVLKKAKGKGYVVYANHTNPFHDALSPAIVLDRHIYTIAIPANLFIPRIGKFLPYLGILPLGSTPEQKQEFHKAIDTRLKQGNCLVVYPEAHVWPYATKIRKFPQGDRSFIYPVRNNLPIFTMTTTYHQSKIKGQKRPDMTVYLDGPFYPDADKTEAENMAKLAEEAYESMVKWSKKNSYEYFQYRRKPAKKK